MIVILLNIRSIFNVASVFRTADALGVKKIYLGGITPAPLDKLGKLRQQFTKVSLGAEKYVRWEKVNATPKLIGKLKRENYKILAVEQNPKSISYFRVKKLPKKYALVLGSEIKGLPTSILKKCDKILEIPMKGKKESLNVSVAFGIVGSYLVYNVRNA